MFTFYTIFIHFASKIVRQIATVFDNGNFFKAVFERSTIIKNKTSTKKTRCICEVFQKHFQKYFYKFIDFKRKK